MGTDARNGPENRPIKIASTPHFLMKTSPRGSNCGCRENGHAPAIELLNLLPTQYESQSPSASPTAPAIQTGTKSTPPAPIIAPIPTRAAQDGRISEMKASDSRNASAKTIGAAHAS